MKQTLTSIGLSNGDFFDFTKPEKHKYDIETIARSLAKQCRYTGHTDDFSHYSIAEHCWHVSYAVPEHLALEGLMHDSSEAFTGDIAKPLKNMLPEFEAIEDRIEAAMAKFYGLQFPYPPEIKTADKLLYCTERQQIATSVKDKLWHTETTPSNTIKIRCWEPELAARMFMVRFNTLMNNRNMKKAA
jgi:uncharacterized protein